MSFYRSLVPKPVIPHQRTAYNPSGKKEGGEKMIENLLDIILDIIQEDSLLDILYVIIKNALKHQKNTKKRKRPLDKSNGF